MQPSVHEGPNICRLARSALDRALEIMGTSKGNVQLIRWDNGATLHIVAQQGFDDEFLAVFKR